MNYKRKRDDNKSRGLTKKQKPYSTYIARAIKQAIRRDGETKVCDTFQSQTSFYDSQYVSGDLCQIAQGAGINERIGLKVRPIGLHLRYDIFAASGSTTCDAYRIIIVQDTRDISSAPLITEYLRDVTSVTTAFTAYLAPKNYQISPNFKILMDKQGIIGRPDDSNGKVFGHEMVVKVPFKEVCYKGSASNLTANSNGRIFIYFMSTHGGVSEAPQLTYHCRMYFKDH